MCECKCTFMTIPWLRAADMRLSERTSIPGAHAATQSVDAVEPHFGDVLSQPIHQMVIRNDGLFCALTHHKQKSTLKTVDDVQCSTGLQRILPSEFAGCRRALVRTFLMLRCNAARGIRRRESDASQGTKRSQFKKGRHG